MDSITQAALGAAVGTAVMGRSRPLWQAALGGALIGTLPDLDVFMDKGDPVRDMVLHRAETHALFWQALASPLFAWILAWLSGTRELFARWWVMVVLTLFTHVLLDTLTIYGTRVWLPFSDQPVGLGSLFIIDPLYTLPLLFGLGLALAGRGPARRRWNTAGLVLSTLYAGWSVAAQAHVTGMVHDTPEAEGLTPAQVLVTPTPFNTLLWRIVLLRPDHYEEGFYSLLDGPADPLQPVQFERFPRYRELDRKTADFEAATMIRRFSKGFYALADDGRHITITDLRMGQHPYYAFSFVVAQHRSKPVSEVTPQRIARRLPFDEGLQWLWRRLRGHDFAPPR